MNKPNCIIVECNPEWRNRLRKLLDEEGFQVYSASDPREAIDKLRTQHFNLMTLDLTLEPVKVNSLKPARRGFELLTRITKDKDISIPPVIIVSGTESLEDVLFLLNTALAQPPPYKLVYFAHKATFYHPENLEKFMRAAQDAVNYTKTDATTPKKLKAKSKENDVFVAKSFNDADKEINSYFEDILDALDINYITGSDYEGSTPPRKVRKRIDRACALVAIVVGRWKDKENRLHAPNWLIREITHAESQDKPIIILVEEGAKYLAGLGKEHELIYFDRNSMPKLKTATHRFLQALHKCNFV